MHTHPHTVAVDHASPTFQTRTALSSTASNSRDVDTVPLPLPPLGPPSTGSQSTLRIGASTASIVNNDSSGRAAMPSCDLPEAPDTPTAAAAAAPAFPSPPGIFHNVAACVTPISAWNRPPCTVATRSSRCGHAASCHISAGWR